MYAIFRITFVFFMITAVLFPKAESFGDTTSLNLPIYSPNRFPAHFIVPPFIHESPGTIKTGNLEAKFHSDYFSMYAYEYSQKGELIMDMEGNVFDFSLTYGITDTLSAGISQSFVTLQSGFLDGVLESFHDAFGFSNYGRGQRPDNSFRYSIVTNGNEWFEAPLGGLHLTDGVFTLKQRLYAKKKVKAAFLYRLSLPFGDEDHGFGSGGFGHGFFIPLSYENKKWLFSATPGFVIPHSPEYTDLDVFYGITSHASYLLNKSFSIQTGFYYYTSPFGDEVPYPLDKDSLEWLIGLRYGFSRNIIWEIAFKEDITRGAPDFTLHLGFSIDMDLT